MLSHEFIKSNNGMQCKNKKKLTSQRLNLLSTLKFQNALTIKYSKINIQPYQIKVIVLLDTP